LGLSRDIEALTEEQRAFCLRILPRPTDMQKLCEAVTALLLPDRVPIPQPSSHVHLQRTPLGFELDGEPLSLTSSEECILDALYARRGDTVPRAELCALLENDTNEKLADVYVCLLRRKLEAGGHPRLLFTVRGVGYRLKVEE
jgi:DNA-binding response OmpR family regulator